MNTAWLIHLEGKTYYFFKRGYLYSDFTISRIMYPVEVHLIEDTFVRIFLLYKIKTIDFLFLFSELAAKM